MTLAEFLLARIADDKARWANPAFAPVAGVGLSELVTKMRAECEAKRRMVEHAERAHEMAKVGPSAGDGAWFLACRYLAVPYADHPDYHEEWRP